MCRATVVNPDPGVDRIKKKCVVHAVRESVSRAIMSSSFVGMTRHDKPDSVLMRPLLSIPFSSFSFESITGFRIARCVKGPDRRVVFSDAAGKNQRIDRRERGRQAEE